MKQRIAIGYRQLVLGADASPIVIRPATFFRRSFLIFLIRFFVFFALFCGYSFSLYLCAFASLREICFFSPWLREGTLHKFVSDSSGART
jgi:hypothetical protein